MTQTNFLELAKTGEPRVIAGLLNRSLQNQGVTCKATRRNGELHLLLEGDSLVDHEDSIVEYITQALSRLQVPAMPISIYARVPNSDKVLWRHNINYDGPEEVGLPAMPANFTLPRPETAEPEMTPNLDDDRYEEIPDSPEDNFASVNFFDAATEINERSFEEEQNGLKDTDAPYDTFLDGDEAEDTAESEEGGTPYDNWLDKPEESETTVEHQHSLSMMDEESEFDEEDRPRKSGVPILPLTLAAIVALLFAGAGAYYRFILFEQSPQVSDNPPVSTPVDPSLEAPSVEPPPAETLPEPPVVSTTPPETPTPTINEPTSENPWRDAINAAMDAAVQAQTAQTPEEWSGVAETWEQSIQLLLIVPEDDPNYVQAQEKVVEYTNNLDVARTRELNALNQ